VSVNETFVATFNPLNAELKPIRHLLTLAGAHHFVHVSRIRFNPLNAELKPIRHLLALAGAHHFVDVSRIRVNVGSCSATKDCPFYGVPEHAKCGRVSWRLRDCYAMIIGVIVKGTPV
jgi:hypothetical protein